MAAAGTMNATFPWDLGGVPLRPLSPTQRSRHPEMVWNPVYNTILSASPRACLYHSNVPISSWLQRCPYMPSVEYQLGLVSLPAYPAENFSETGLSACWVHLT